MNVLVGHTGFVGSNIIDKYNFEATYNSKNIEMSFGTNPELCVYSGVRAEKFLANKNPEEDFSAIKNAINNIKKINPKKLVLISTIDVWNKPQYVNELDKVDTSELSPYGYNRYYFEQWCRENIENFYVLRLPGLFGSNLKKNFIFDMINYLPTMLNEQKYRELLTKSKLIKKHYQKQKNGFYKLFFATLDEKIALQIFFEKIGFSALNFTDSRSIYQFYNLAYLWEHIKIMLDQNIPLLHLAVEPVSAGELYETVFEEPFNNILNGEPVKYDFQTLYSENFGGTNGYIFDKKIVIEEIKTFINNKGVI